MTVQIRRGKKEGRITWDIIQLEEKRRKDGWMDKGTKGDVYQTSSYVTFQLFDTRFLS